MAAITRFEEIQAWKAEFARFLRYTRRSATEVQSELYVALDQHYITTQEFTEVSGQV